MTEAEWLMARNPNPMLAFVRDKVSDRKLRLFAVACCNRVQGLTDHDRDQLAEIERVADGMVSPSDLIAAIYDWTLHPTVFHASAFEAETAAVDVVARCSAIHAESHGDTTHPREQGDYFAAEAVEMSAECRILRDLAGSLFRPVAVDQSWLTSTVIALARQMYESRDYTLMPILADALQDSGCYHPDIFAHCRRYKPHVRGCWVVDLILSKDR